MVDELSSQLNYKIEREGEFKNLIVDFIGTLYYPSIEDSPACMRRIMEILEKEGHVNTITLREEKNYVYPEDQVELLNEIRDIYVYLVKDKKILRYTYKQLSKVTQNKAKVGEYLEKIRRIVYVLLKEDPIGAYVYAKRLYRYHKVKFQKYGDKIDEVFVLILDEIKSLLERTKLIQKVKNRLEGYRIGDRSLYREIFFPFIRPNFVFTKLIVVPPKGATEIDRYSFEVEGGIADVMIYETEEEVRKYYHIIPPEFKLSDKEMDLLTAAREIISKYTPTSREADVEVIRKNVEDMSRDVLIELQADMGLNFSYERIERLAKILKRLTIGFGILEVILSDNYIEDIYVNPPPFSTKIFVKHNIYGEMISNVILSPKEIDGWITRLRFFSGRPLDEAHPVLDTEIRYKYGTARVAAIQNPFSPYGYGLAIRRYRAKPWTLPLFVKVKYLSPLAAGLLWFLIDGSRTMLVAGTRGAGKTSLMISLMLMIPRRFRIITIEDVLEIPSWYFRKLGFDILSLKVRSAIIGEASELSAEDGIRTSLRLGDSCLIIGEVRSKEAFTLYEAMRIGAMANVVMGTIHGESAYGVFDRVVNDLQVHPTSFKATDVIIVANKLRTPDMRKEIRRVVGITEIKKHWREDPLLEKGFLDLMRYDPYKDILYPTRELIEGESDVLKSIAQRVREWAGKWERVWDNIVLRGEIIKKMVEYADTYKRPDILEADFVVRAVDAFHVIFGKIMEERGYPTNEEVIKEFEKWLKETIRKS